MYKLTNFNSVIRLSDGACIPFAEGNTDYQQYLKDVAAGATVEQYVAPPEPVPTSITMRQARLALLNAGLLAQVNAAVAASSQAAQIEWEFSNEVQRSNVLIGELAASLGLDSATLDQLFIAGSKL